MLADEKPIHNHYMHVLEREETFVEVLLDTCSTPLFCDSIESTQCNGSASVSSAITLHAVHKRRVGHNPV